jgi:hypothetical protein
MAAPMRRSAAPSSPYPLDVSTKLIGLARTASTVAIARASATS